MSLKNLFQLLVQQNLHFSVYIIILNKPVQNLLCLLIVICLFLYIIHNLIKSIQNSSKHTHCYKYCHHAKRCFQLCLPLCSNQQNHRLRKIKTFSIFFKPPSIFYFVTLNPIFLIPYQMYFT
jgi:hypothetical protein